MGTRLIKYLSALPVMSLFFFFSLPLSDTLYVRERVGGVEGGGCPSPASDFLKKGKKAT